MIVARRAPAAGLGLSGSTHQCQQGYPPSARHSRLTIFILISFVTEAHQLIEGRGITLFAPPPEHPSVH